MTGGSLEGGVTHPYDTGNLGKRHFNQRGSLQNLVQEFLDAGNVCKPTWTSPEAAAGQFMHREGL